jgi:hypothetical protein
LVMQTYQGAVSGCSESTRPEPGPAPSKVEQTVTLGMDAAVRGGMEGEV